MNKKHLLTYLLMLTLASGLFGQQNSAVVTINWMGTQTLSYEKGSLSVLNFEGAVNHDRFGLLPVFSKLYRLPAPGLSYQFGITDEVYEAFTTQEKIAEIADASLIGSQIRMINDMVAIRGDYFSQLQLLPLRYNETTGKFEKLVSFSIEASLVPEENFKFGRNTREYAENSVLSEGDWYKVGIARSGIHKLSYQDMEALGMQVSDVDPDEIKIYGNGGGMLPESNSEFRHDDLQENAIWVAGADDGSFDPDDYILFYAEGPEEWEYVPLKLAFKHIRHRYSNLTHYFVTVSPGKGKRVESLPLVTEPADAVITNYNDYLYHELDTINLIRSGAEWYGEEFSDILSYDFTFDFPNRDLSQNIFVVCDFAARSDKVSSFMIYMNGDSLMEATINAVPPGSVTQYANSLNKSKRLKVQDTDRLDVNITYDKPTDQSKAWLNYIELNVMSNLVFEGEQFGFRNIYTTNEGQISEFQITGAGNAFRVWDVTNPLEPKAVVTQSGADLASFRAATDTLREFVGFGESDYFQPSLIGRIENQNLHAIGGKDFLIVSYPDFMAQAERVKALHEEIDQMDISIVTPAQIYNEFSSGTTDPTAIRDFVRMVYLRSGNPPALKYLMLFGDGSYDPKDRIIQGRNFIPTYQSKQSLWYTSSYVTDDYFGLMDENEGADAGGNVDIGIGRLPVNSVEEAEHMADKIEHYMRNSQDVKGTWRNTMCFIADDEDYNLHVYQADTVLVKIIERNNKTININKIYFDAYQQESSTAGHRYPEVNKAFNEQVQEGTLVVNYTGHGGELGLAHEHVLGISDINSWSNYDMLPVFITATCEFSRFDNPLLTSAGELVLLNRDGGGVALFTTTRLAFASSNLTLNRRIYDTLFSAQPGHYPRLGDLIMFSKNPSNTNIRNFVLLGNPALKLALPQYNILTDSINGKPADSFRDTLKANSRVEISGRVSGFQDSKPVVETFNGVVHIKLYDKAEEITTLANDPRSMPYEFELQNSVLFEGVASVVNGRFDFSFVVPKDIAYDYGPGKISYYATDSIFDATGAFKNFIIGGFDDQTATDQTGPDIDLYLNDSLFRNGSIINNQPVMLAYLSDPSGINAVGTGIGHDIIATLDGNFTNSIILNHHYVPVVDDFTSGSIEFPLGNLEEGLHTLELKAWDMYNNSSTKAIEFHISNILPVEMEQVFNYPNPFSDETWFTFRHNQFGDDLSVEIEIFNFNGQLVRTIGPQKVFSNGYLIEPIRWDGTATGGEKLRPGWYVYKLNVYNAIGLTSQMVQKMIITN